MHDLSAALGPSSGLDSDDVNPLDIQRLMERYVSNSGEWASYALGDGSRSYTRNLIDEGNGKSNLVSERTPSCWGLGVGVEPGELTCEAHFGLESW